MMETADNLTGKAMAHWLPWALIALVLYGFWGFFPKLAVRSISPQSALIYEIAGGILVGLAVLLATRSIPEYHGGDVFFSVLTGVSGLLGTLFFFMAVKRGPIAVVVSLTALYPLISILLAYFWLREPISLKQGAGILLAIAAIFLMTS